MDELGDIEPKACETIPSSEAGVQCCSCDTAIDGVPEVTKDAVNLLVAPVLLKSRETERGTEYRIERGRARTQRVNAKRDLAS